MVINNGHGVEEGSKDKIGFELQQHMPQLQKCETSTIGDFSPGETFVWNDLLLKDCEKLWFNAASLSIDFRIKSSGTDKFCPASVEVVMNDEQNTSFFTDNMNCDYDKNKNWFKHTAKIRSFK